jgi:hypothetical protein
MPVTAPQNPASIYQNEDVPFWCAIEKARFHSSSSHSSFGGQPTISSQ